MRGGTSGRSQRRGGNAIEFALVVPVLLAITAGIIDYGWYYSQYLSAIHAARQAARAAAGDSSDDVDTPCDVAEAEAVSVLTGSGFAGMNDTYVQVEVGTDGTWQRVNVVITIPYGKLWGLVPTPTNIVGRANARMEDQGQLDCGPE